MAGFFAFPDSAIREITAYTRWLLIRNQVRTEVLAKHQEDPNLDLAAATEQASERVSQAWAEASSHPVPILRDPSPASIARGAALFAGEKAACFSCHGKRGGGKGPAAWDPVNERWLLQDLWGEEVRPRNLKETLLGGATAADVWRRIAFGVPGTPMPAHHERLAPEEIEALVHFVLSLQKSP
jgi:mono/diheme cytochrome c family protein